MTVEPRLEPRYQALAAFLRDLPELYETNPEQFVAYQGGKRLRVSKGRSELAPRVRSRRAEVGRLHGLRHHARGRRLHARPRAGGVMPLFIDRLP